MSGSRTATKADRLIEERQALRRVIELAEQFIADGAADLGVHMTLESLLARDRLLAEAIAAEHAEAPTPAWLARKHAAKKCAP